jgi:hypothetical protein
MGGLASCAPIPEDDVTCSSCNENKFVEHSAFNAYKNSLYSFKYW